jgi:type IV secretion system protein VirB7
MKQWWMSLVCICLLNGCSKTPDLDAPCRQFGQYCSQQPINETPILGEQK